MRQGERPGPRDGGYPRRLLLALLSALVPGSGQMVAGERRRGAVMLGLTAALFVVAGVLAAQGADEVLSYLVRPRVLLGSAGLNLVLLAFRLYAAVDAFRVGGGPFREVGQAGPSPVVEAGRESLSPPVAPSFAAAPPAPAPPTAAPPAAHWSAGADASAAVTDILGATTTDGRSPSGRQTRASPPHGRVAAGLALALLLLVVVAAPHAIAGYYAYLSHDLLTAVFVSDGSAEPLSGEPSADGVGDGLTLSTSTTAGPAVLPVITVPTASTLPPTTDPPTTTEPVVPLGSGEDERLTVLLIGTDAGYGRKGARADSVMVATVDLEEGWVALFGIPRNAGDLSLEGKTAKALGTRTYRGMISDLYEEAWNHSELAPEGGDPGAEVLRQTATTLLGIPVDYYAVIDMGGFVDLVDAFGGVTLNVKDRINVRLSPPRKGDPWKVYDIEPGKRHLEGFEALAFARSRTGTSDYDRMRRQRCVLKALLHQNGVAEMALKFSSVVKVVRDHLGTDVPIDALPELVKVRGRLRTDTMLAVGFTPPDYLAGRNELGYNILDQDKVQATVREFIEQPEAVLARQDPDLNVDTGECWMVE